MQLSKSPHFTFYLRHFLCSYNIISPTINLITSSNRGMADSIEEEKKAPEVKKSTNEGVPSLIPKVLPSKNNFEFTIHDDSRVGQKKRRVFFSSTFDSGNLRTVTQKSKFLVRGDFQV